MTVLTNRSRLGSRGINGKIRVRILRPWRGLKVGDIITPPGGMRRELLRKTDQLGNKFAEIDSVVEQEAPAVKKHGGKKAAQK